MNNNQSYYQFGLQHLNYKSAQDLYERLYLKALIDAYQRIDKSSDIENNLRDRFIWDLERINPLTKGLIDNNILQLDFERSHFVTQTEKRRTDIVFFISGFEKFTIECKCLYQQLSKNKSYLDEGLLRYIELKYSERNKFAGMIGFVISGNITDVQDSVINNALSFHPSVSQPEIKKSELFDWEYSFITCHERINKEDIQIYHFLFPFIH